MLRIEEEKNRVGWNNPVNEGDTEIEDMFDRVHRHPGPWAGVDIVVMQVVYAIIKGLPMD